MAFKDFMKGKPKAPMVHDIVVGQVAAAENPYIAARREWMERYGDFIAQKHTWQIISMALLAALSLSVAGNVYQGSQSKIQPFLVEVNKYGDPIGVRNAEKGEEANAKMVGAQVARFIKLTRSVTTDGKVQKDWLKEAYGMATPNAAAFLNEYYRKNDPFELARLGQRVTVTVQQPMPLSDKTMSVEWEEEKVGQQGELINRTRYKALVPTSKFVPETVEQLMGNPAGVLIDIPQWSQQL